MYEFASYIPILLKRNTEYRQIETQSSSRIILEEMNGIIRSVRTQSLYTKSLDKKRLLKKLANGDGKEIKIKVEDNDKKYVKKPVETGIFRRICSISLLHLT